ncbi:MAG: dipeptidase [Sulfobacillus sp.]
METEWSEDLQTHRLEGIARLEELLRIPSISTSPEHVADVRRAAEWVQRGMEKSGFEAVIEPTSRHPVVWGKSPVQSGRPTILIYAHYDVQPADPLELWTSPPFEPTVRDGQLFARGVSDDKGQLVMHLLALDSFRRVRGTFPANIVLVFEGEEEIGSPNLPAFIRRHRQELKADAVVISDSTMLAPGRPTLVTGLRGMAGFEVIVSGPARDVHSGLFGGLIANPAAALVQMLAACHDRTGHVAIPGFYDGVVPPPESEVASWQHGVVDPKAVLAATGAQALVGEEGYSLAERLWARPTLELNGIASGVRQGQKTIIPAVARASVTCRLVVGQDPQRISQLVADFLVAKAPPGVQVEVIRHDASPASEVAIDSKAARLAMESLAAGLGHPAQLVRQGASIPIVPVFQEVLEAPVLLMGFGLETDNFHSPDEHWQLDNLDAGLRTMVTFWQGVAQGQLS